MPRIKPKRTAPRLDMTPMVDLAFLLVTFFMLTTNFRAQEPVTVVIPPSHSDIIIPEKNVIYVTVSKDGRAFFDLSNQTYRKDLLGKMSAQYGVQFTEPESQTFATMGSFGMPMNQMKSFLDMTAEERNKIAQPGIPYDSTNNELGSWVLNARLVDNMQLAIKGDQTTDYAYVKQVINTLQDKADLKTFNLVTSLESGPAGDAKK
jgi:biopolymer transport protein ExbD